MHTETQRSAQADIIIPTRFWYTSSSDNGKAGGASVPPRPSDNRDVRLLLVVLADAEEADAVVRAVAGERGLHGHHMAAVVSHAGDEDALQRPIQRQPELLAAAEPLVDHDDRGRPERVRPRQGAQPAAADWPLVREDRAVGLGNATPVPVVYNVIVWAELRDGGDGRARHREQERAGCRAATERNPREARTATASCASASAQPAPAAWPVTAVTVGTGSASRSATRPRNARGEAVPRRRGQPRARPREVVAVAEELALGGQDERIRIPN
jgi:hypothetical protein